MLREYDVVQLNQHLPLKNLVAGVRGTVVMVYNGPNNSHAYEVEFVDDKGNTLALVTLTEDQITRVWSEPNEL